MNQHIRTALDLIYEAATELDHPNHTPINTQHVAEIYAMIGATPPIGNDIGYELVDMFEHLSLTRKHPRAAAALKQHLINLLQTNFDPEN